MKISRYLEELPSWAYDKWEVEEAFNPFSSGATANEPEEAIDLSQYREVSIKSKDKFEAININDLLG
jgi:hypothetical protein